MAYDHVVFDKNWAGPRGAWPMGAILTIGTDTGQVPRDIAEGMVEDGNASWVKQEGKKYVRITNPRPRAAKK